MYGLKFKELVIIIICKTLNKILRKLNYNQTNKSVYNEMKDVYNEGFQIKRNGNKIIINRNNWYSNKKFVIRLLTSDKEVLKQVIINNEYLPIIDLIKSRNAEQSIELIVDLGSNIGLTSLFFNTHFANATIFAVEPDEDNFTILKENIDINNVNANVILINKAIWTNSTDKLFINNEFRDKREWARALSYLKDNSKCVQLITLNDIVQYFNCAKVIDILKMDIEGTEYELFKSREFLLILVRYVRFMCFEIHEEIKERIFFYEILKQINFEYIAEGETIFCYNRSLG